MNKKMLNYVPTIEDKLKCGKCVLVVLQPVYNIILELTL